MAYGGLGICSVSNIYAKCSLLIIVLGFFIIPVQKRRRPLYCRFDIEGELDHHKRQEVYGSMYMQLRIEWVGTLVSKIMPFVLKRPI